MRVAIALILLLLLPSAAQAEKRIALLIGNQTYAAEIGALANPHNDVALLERTLKALSFEVATVRDAGLAALTRAVNAYARRLADGGPTAVGFFYYSGHGAADGGINYLIPIDVKSTETGDLWDQSLRLTEITHKLRAEAGNATHFVVFDACRNTLRLRRPGTWALVQSKGFAPVVQMNGMLVAYATAEGELASDVGDGAGPYARVLVDEMVKPGVEAVTMFRRVQVRVRSAIGQEPWLGFSALGEVHFAGAQGEAASPTPSAQATWSGDAERAWAIAKDTTSVEVLEAFIARYKDTFLADLARARLNELKKQQAGLAVPPRPPAELGGTATSPQIYSKVGNFACFAEAEYPDSWREEAPLCAAYGCNFGKMSQDACLALAARKGSKTVIHGNKNSSRANECWLQNSCGNLQPHYEFSLFRM